MPLPAFFIASAFFAEAALAALLFRAPFARLPLESRVIFVFFAFGREEGHPQVGEEG